jgi:hypothetical protein
MISWHKESENEDDVGKKRKGMKCEEKQKMKEVK